MRVFAANGRTWEQKDTPFFLVFRSLNGVQLDLISQSSQRLLFKQEDTHNHNLIHKYPDIFSVCDSLFCYSHVIRCWCLWVCRSNNERRRKKDSWTLSLFPFTNEWEMVFTSWISEPANLLVPRECSFVRQFSSWWFGSRKREGTEKTNDKRKWKRYWQSVHSSAQTIERMRRGIDVYMHLWCVNAGWDGDEKCINANVTVTSSRDSIYGPKVYTLDKKRSKGSSHPQATGRMHQNVPTSCVWMTFTYDDDMQHLFVRKAGRKKTKTAPFLTSDQKEE